MLARNSISDDEILRRIPVVVLTTSGAEEDVFGSYKLNANCYIVKPIEFKKFTEIIESIHKFWTGVATLPSGIDG